MRFVPLLAALEWIKIVVPLVVFTIITLNRLFSSEAAKKRLQQQRPRPPAPPQAPPANRPRGEDEVAEFLRRATQSKEQRPAAPPAPPKSARRGASAPAPVRRLTPKRDENAPLYDDDAPQTRKAAATAGESSSSGGKRGDGPRHSEIEQADEAMELQIHQALDHQVGSLAGTTTTTTNDARPAPEDESRARSVSALLRDQQSIRDAIIVSEILRRPTERW